MLLPLVVAQDILIHHNLRIRREKPFKRRFHVKVQEWKFLKARILTFASVTGMLTNKVIKESFCGIFFLICVLFIGVLKLKVNLNLKFKVAVWFDQVFEQIVAPIFTMRMSDPSR